MNRIFFGPFGLRAGWRFLLFAIAAALIGTAYAFLTHGAPGIVKQFTGAVAALGGMAVMWRIDGKPFTAPGLIAINSGRNLAAGAIAGFVALSALMGLLVLVHAFRPGAPELHGIDVLRWGLYWTIFFVAVALGEELITRGYPLFSLAQGMGFWPAAAFLSLLFGAGHLGNSGEEWIGIANAILAGFMLAYSVKWTGSLWWGIGYHLTWDWAESFFYGVADSGNKAPHHFLSGDPIGAPWLSGGSVGPEGSVLATVILILLFFVVRFTTPRYDNPELHRRTRPRPVDDALDSSGIPVA